MVFHKSLGRLESRNLTILLFILYSDGDFLSINFLTTIAISFELAEGSVVPEMEQK